MANLKQKIAGRKLRQELSLKGGVVVIDQNSCDGCGDCIESCKHDAIRMKELSQAEIRQLSLKGRLKVRIKGKQKAFIDPGLCTACGRCMKHCHEIAIHKVKA